MMDFFTIEQIDEVAGVIRSRIKNHPRVAIILGSGLGVFADAVEDATILPFKELPYWPVTTVAGHSGRLVAGKLEGQDVLVMQGRLHYYEGYSLAETTLPVRVFKRLGIEILIVTNAAGGVNPDFQPGDLMLITDHINLIGMAGLNPLRGPNLDEFGPRFPDMSQAYDRQLTALARQVAEEHQITPKQGVYVCLAGPSFESPADLRFLRLIGVDAVGMSTVPEVIAARHAGMRVLGIATISNKANLDGNTLTTHEEVLLAGRLVIPKLTTVIRGLLHLL